MYARFRGVGEVVIIPPNTSAVVISPSPRASLTPELTSFTPADPMSLTPPIRGHSHPSPTFLTPPIRHLYYPIANRTRETNARLHIHIDPFSIAPPLSPAYALANVLIYVPTCT